ncbi:MAG TPA: low temperature requirement protein A, partial [Gaiellaceae bacterium]|nr:low temperature requirement protein A [Gaiellaceae bacterium]
ARSALRGFGYWHLLLLLAVVCIAAAQREAMAHPFAATGWWLAAVLAGGVATFLAADVLFLREFAIEPRHTRAGAAAAALAAAPIGVLISPFAESIALVLVVATALIIEARLRPSRVVSSSRSAVAGTRS